MRCSTAGASAASAERAFNGAERLRTFASKAGTADQFVFEAASSLSFSGRSFTSSARTSASVVTFIEVVTSTSYTSLRLSSRVLEIETPVT